LGVFDYFRCHLGADEDEKDYFKEVEMAQALGQAQQAVGFVVNSNIAAHFTAVAPCNNAQSGNLANISMDPGGVTATPGAIGGMPGTPLSSATPLVNSSMFGANNVPVTPWTGPNNNSMQATPLTGGHGGNGGGALSFATPSSASMGANMMMHGGEQTPDMLSGMHTPGAMGPPPLAAKGPAPPRRGRTSAGGGEAGGCGARGGGIGSLGFGVVRSLDGENTDPLLGNLSTPVTHAVAPSREMPAPASATRRVTRSAAATASSTGVGSINLPLGSGSERTGSGGSNDTTSMEEDLPPHKKKPHLQQQNVLSGSLAARQSQNWQTGGSSSWTVSCQSPRVLREQSSSAPMLPSAADTSELCALFRQLAKAYRHLCMYRSHEAITAFTDLPKCQHNTGWVLAQLATVCSCPRLLLCLIA